MGERSVEFAPGPLNCDVHSEVTAVRSQAVLSGSGNVIGRPPRERSESYHNMASIAPSRLAALVKTRCTVFQTSYNPTSVRTGAKYLRGRLRGPSMLNYYPPTFSLASIIRQFPEMELVDAAEQQRLQDVEDRKKRGKGAPKKAKSKGLSLLSLFSSILFTKLFVCGASSPADSRRTSRKR